MSAGADPLADPRAADLIAAAPAEVAALASDFRAASSESETTATGLRAAQRDTVWTGPAADTFRRAIGRLPAELEQVRAGFDDVALALGAYEADLAVIRPAFIRTVAELEVASDSVQTAELEQRAYALLDEFSGARQRCRFAIELAQEGALRPWFGAGTTIIDLEQGTAGS